MILNLILFLGLSLIPSAAWSVFPFIPPNAKLYLPLLAQEAKSKWPDLKEPWTLAGQVEQESCISLTNKRCWSPTAELKTSREWGIGLSQVTIMYDKNGKIVMNSMEDIKRLDPTLKGWNLTTTRLDPTYQLRALLVYDKSIYDKFPKTITNQYEKIAFTLAAYNGGLGGTLSDRRLCQNTKGCNPDLWFGNVEKTSFKAKIKVNGYGKSFYEINREYPRNILTLRRQKYESFFTQPQTKL